MNDSSPATNQDFQDPNDLATEISQEQEQALINETLGLGGSNDNTTPSNDAGTPTDDGTEKPEAPKAEEKVEEPKPEEPRDPVSEPVEDKPKEEPKEEPKEPETVKTDDLWIEVEKVTKDEDGNVKTERVKLVFDPQNPDAFVPEDFQFSSDKQLFKILDAKSEMAALYKERQAEFEAKQKELSEKTDAKKAEAEKLAGWDAEIQDLIEGGLLEAPKAKPGDKDFLEDPSVKKIDEVFKYMTAKNEERSKEGKPPIASFAAAFAQYTNDEKVKAEEEALKKEQEETKAKGAMVGGSSAASGGNTPAYKAGEYGSIWDVPVET